MSRRFSCLLFAALICSVRVFGGEALHKGIYSGTTRGILVPKLSIFVVVDSGVGVEVYQPMKGERIGGIEDTLVQISSITPSEYVGERYRLRLGPKGWVLSGHTKSVLSWNGEIKNLQLSDRSPEIKRLDQYRNEAYLHNDLYKIDEEIRSQRPSANAFTRASQLRHQLGADELAAKLSHIEFLTAYESIRKKIISEIMH